MSLENRYLKYTEDITEDVYNEVIEVLDDLNASGIEYVCDYSLFKHDGFININSGLYCSVRREWTNSNKITVVEILTYKKQKTSPINSLFKRHYNAIVKRGLIDEFTNIKDFLIKLDEEVIELKEAKVGSEEFKQEGVDCAFVIMNMLIDNGVDIEKELIKNIEHQETRED